MQGLFDKGAYEIVIAEDVPDGGNILGGRFVLTIKNKNTGEMYYKARYVVQCHNDREKNRLVNNSSNLKQSSVRTITALAAIFGFRIWSHGQGTIAKAA